MNKGKIHQEIERLEKSREIDKFNYSNNVVAYIGGLAILFPLTKIILARLWPTLPEWRALFIVFIVWSGIIWWKNSSTNFNFMRKALMIDKRYKKLGIDLPKLNRELKKIKRKDIKEYYKQNGGS